MYYVFPGIQSMSGLKMGKFQAVILEHLRDAAEDLVDYSVAFLISGMSSRLLRENYTALQSETLNRRIRRSVKHLESRGLIEVRMKSGEPFIRLSKSNNLLKQRLDLDSIKLNSQPEWDSMWRVVIFDIPERHGKARRALSYQIEKVGALRLQDSVFVYPFPWRDEIETIGDIFQVLPYIRYIEATSIDGAEKLKKYFQLV